MPKRIVNQVVRFFTISIAISATILCGARAIVAPKDAEAASENADDAKVVALLDSEFQRAVKNNDSTTIDRILADNFILVSGRGQTQDKMEELREARAHEFVYEHQEDTNRAVRVWGNTAVVTALLWAKGSAHSKPFDEKLWFSDVYLRTPKGWRYVFGQASLPLPATSGN